MTRRRWMLFLGAVAACSMLFLVTQSLRASEGHVPVLCTWDCEENPPCETDSGCLGENCWCDEGICR